MKAAVLDASVVVKLIVCEAESPDARDILASLDRAVIPEWCTLECASAVWKHASVNGLDAETASLSVRALERLDLDTVSAQSLVSASMDLALERDHSPCDCLYVVLAYAEGLPLVTADRTQHSLAESTLGANRSILLENWRETRRPQAP